MTAYLPLPHLTALPVGPRLPLGAVADKAGALPRAVRGKAPFVADRSAVGRGAGAATVAVPAPPARPDPKVAPRRLWLAGAAVVMSSALHAGLVAAWVGLGGGVPPLRPAEVEVAEVALIPEAVFQAMTAPQPDLAALAAPAGLAASAQPGLSADVPVDLPMPEKAHDKSAAAEVLAQPTADPLPKAEALLAPQAPPAPEPPLAPEPPQAAEPPEAKPKAKAEAKPKAADPAADLAAAKPVVKTAKAAPKPDKVQPDARSDAPAKASAPAAGGTVKPASAKAASPGQGKKLKADWGAKLRARINRKVARVDGATPGTVKVRLTVAPSGALISVEVAASSGQAALDRAAMKAVKAAAPFPRAPKGLSEASYSFTLPIRFDG